MKELEQIRIGSKTNPGKAAGFISKYIAENGEADVRSIGPKAVFQATKAIAIARDMLSKDEIDIMCVPNFAAAEIDGEERQAIRIYLVAVPVIGMEAADEQG